MRLLDLYICRKFIGNLLFSIFAFLCIFIIIDAVEKLSDYIDKGTPILRILEYYLYFIPEILTLTMPLSVLLAAMFSIGQLTRFNEILAMKASGVSLYRILTPIFSIGLVLSIFMIYFVEAIVPKANTARAEIKGVYIDKHKRFTAAQISNLYIQESDDKRIFIAYYNSSDKLARTVSILRFEGNFIRERIDAELMQWEEDKWVLSNAYLRDLSKGGELYEYRKSLEINDLQSGPKELGEVQKNPLEMNYRELEKFIGDVRRNGGDPNRWLVDLYLKISFPFANLIIVLFGAVLASNRVRSTGAGGVAMSLIICFFYFMVVKAGQTFGQTGAMHPMLAAWLGNILFFFGSIYLLIRAPK